MSGFPVDDLIKCRENTTDGRRRNLSIRTDCAYVLHCDTAPNGSQCLNHLTVVVLSSQTQSAAPGPPLTHPKGCLLQRHFSKRKAFLKKEKKKNHYTFHIRTLTNIEADAEHSSVHFLFVKQLKHTVAAELCV